MIDDREERGRSARSVTRGEVRRDYHMLNNSYCTSDIPTYDSSAIAPDADMISSLRTGPGGWDSSQKILSCDVFSFPHRIQGPMYSIIEYYNALYPIEY